MLMSAENDCLEGNTSLCLDEVRSLHRSTPIIEFTQLGDRSELLDRILARVNANAVTSNASAKLSSHSKVGAQKNDHLRRPLEEVPAASLQTELKLWPTFSPARVHTNALYRLVEFSVTHWAQTHWKIYTRKKHSRNCSTRELWRGSTCESVQLKAKKKPRKWLKNWTKIELIREKLQVLGFVDDVYKKKIEKF